MPDHAALQKRLGYGFSDESLLDLALTHRGSLPAGDESGANQSYERLEFLGDRVLGLAVAQLLFETFPDESEGSLSRRFAALVSANTLSMVASNIDLLPHIKTGKDTGSTDAIVSDACEAVIGAVFRDGGFDQARRVIVKHWQPLMNAVVTPPKDAKTALQEWAQGNGLPLPHYDLIDRAGPDHAPRFSISVSVEGHEPSSGTGSTKQSAEQRAAESLLKRLQ